MTSKPKAPASSHAATAAPALAIVHVADVREDSGDRIRRAVAILLADKEGAQIK